MKTRAAVAFEAKKPLEIIELDLDGPKAGEVLVEIKATGICHTDAYTLDGFDSEGIFPSILGHEGAGIVQEVGSGVTSVKRGDHVIPLYTPECRQCKSCLSGKTNLCTAIRATQGKGLMPDGTTRFSYNGKPIFHYMGCSTFSNFTVLPEIAVARIRDDAPFDKSCYIGCGVTTGVGAVVNTAKVTPGANVVVFGLGGIGLNVIQGAKMVGADKIIGVDINDGKEEWGRRFGMTHFVNPTKTGGDIVQHLVTLTDGGADYTFDCTGNTSVMRQALEACHRGWGVSVIIDGICNSACTLVFGIVPMNKICVTPRASLGFHQAYYDKAFTFGIKVTSAAGTSDLISYYPDAVKDWIRRNGGLTSEMKKIKNGEELWKIVDPCPEEF